MAASLVLADLHGTSHQATIWKYVESQDERIALAMYYPLNFSTNNPVFWRGVASTPFFKRYPNLELPKTLQTGHPWRAAMDLGQIIDGEMELSCGSDRKVTFRWEAKWNRHALMVLLRRRPQLSGLGEAIRRLSS